MKKRSLAFICVVVLIGMVGIKIVGVSKLKDFFIRSPIAALYVEYVRDGKAIDADHLITFLDDGTPIIVNKHDQCVCWFVRLMGYWDSNETKALMQVVKEGSHIIEVGSNFGVHSLRMAKLIGESGKIYAFEANPMVSKYLKQSVKLNNVSNIDVFEKAAGDKPGEIYLDYGIENIGGGYLVEREKASAGSVKTQVVCLDNVIQDNHIDLLKIDAEGSELKILKGAQSILDKNAAHIILMMEWVPSHLKRQGTKPEDLIAFLKSYEFKVWRLGKLQNGEQSFVPISYDALLNLGASDIILSRASL